MSSIWDTYRKQASLLELVSSANGSYFECYILGYNLMLNDTYLFCRLQFLQHGYFVLPFLLFWYDIDFCLLQSVDCMDAVYDLVSVDVSIFVSFLPPFLVHFLSWRLSRGQLNHWRSWWMWLERSFLTQWLLFDYPGWKSVTWLWSSAIWGLQLVYSLFFCNTTQTSISHDISSPSWNFPSQDITQGVRSSTRAVRIAEERLRQLTNMAPPGFLLP